MKLSEAIRLGAMLKPQRFGLHLTRGAGACAIEAAVEAASSDSDHGLLYSTAKELFPIERVLPLTCPACGRRLDNMTATNWLVVYHLNDTHRWTREQIADWVATIEAQHEAQQVQPSEAVCAE